MNHDQILSDLDQIIRRASSIKTMSESEGFTEFMQALYQLRTNSMQDVLASESITESARSIRIGHAQAINSIINVISELISQGDHAAIEKQSLVTQIREDERFSQQQEESMRLQGYHSGGTV